MNYEEAVAYIEDIPRFTTKNSLDHTRECLRRLGNPQEKEFLAEGKEREYRDLIGLIDRILDYVCKESSRARKGIGDIMGGQVLELESERLERLLRERQEEARMKGLV